MNELERNRWMNDSIRSVPVWRRFWNLWWTRVRRHWPALLVGACAAGVGLSVDPWRSAAVLWFLGTALVTWFSCEASLTAHMLRREMRTRADKFEREVRETLAAYRAERDRMRREEGARSA